MFGGEGRFIDRGWADDRYVPKEKWDEWVCCYRCYAKVLKKPDND